jgi:integrase
MGHTDPAITMNVYTHLFDRPQREAAFRKAMVEKVAW